MSRAWRSLKAMEVPEASSKSTLFKVGGYLKLKVEALDEKSFTYTYSVFEGEGLTDKIEKMQFEIKFEPSSRSACTMNTKCFPKGDADLNEDNCKAGKDKILGMYKAVENYLVQNADAYAS